MKHLAFAAFCLALVALQSHMCAATEHEEDIFRFDGAKILQDDEHLGIANGRITCGIGKAELGRIRGVWAPPFVSSDCAIDVRLSGAPLKVSASTWWPDAFAWSGDNAHGHVECRVDLAPGERALVLHGHCDLSKDSDKTALSLTIKGTLDRAARWEFNRAESRSATMPSLSGNAIALRHENDAIAITCSHLNAEAQTGNTLRLTAGLDKHLDYSVVVALGPEAGAQKTAKHLLAAKQITHAAQPLAFPRFTCDNPVLDALYKRSLVHLVMNRWDVPEFKLHPYYSTGSVGGGCVCNYLWNFGEVWEILPLLDPEAMKAHIKHFLQCDITKHFAFEPQTGDAFGPWYMVNQEKIVGLIYFYTLITGDSTFLQEDVAGKRVGDWAVWHAMYGDDPAKPVALIDYGASNSHLELRHQYQYNHVMPDLNGRRYATYHRAEAIARWMGSPHPELLDRAEQLKTVLEKELWDPQAQWFSFIGEGGKRENRYTLQMYKMIGSGVLSDAVQKGLLAHLNENEFLSQYGFHSISKKDPAYDQIDIDNGGGGSCTGFPPQIAERMYKAGLDVPADDLLRRILWWGERMPYWGDSIVANEIAYRKDTPLQCTIDGAAAAQCILFGLLGITPNDGGGISVTPRRTTLFKSAHLSGFKMLGKTVDMKIESDHFEVIVSGKRQRHKLGETARF